MSVNSDAIWSILDNQVKFFFNRDCDADVYAEFEGPRQVICFEPIDGRLFQSFLRRSYRAETDGEICTNFDIYVQAACDDALWDEPLNRVSIRHRVHGSLQKGLVYSLSDAKNRAVVVKPGQWRIVPESKLKTVRFLRSGASSPQVTPTRGGDYKELLRPYINLDEDNFLLLAVWMVQCLSRTSSHFGLIISGSQGTGKSTLCKLVQDCVDPTTAPKSLLPNTERDLKVQLSNGYVVCYDNTKVLKDNVSDVLCSAITGGSVVFRELFTTHDQVVLPLRNVIILNGIDVVPEQSDLSERCLLFEPLPIKKTNRQTDSTIWSKFQKDKPAILGGMFEALSQAMVILPTLQANNLHRMADAHLEMVAIAMALGIDPADFDRIFWNNVDHLKTANTASDPFVEAMIDYLQHRRNNDTQKVSKVLDAMKLDFTNRSCGSYLAALPKNASALSRKLSTVQNALYEAGYTLHFDTKSDGTDLTIKQIAPSRLNKKQKEAAKRRAALIADDDVASNNDSDSDTTTED